ncbi:MAG: NFACT family protein, partial [Candidatus Thorarchaeota archaeon]
MKIKKGMSSLDISVAIAELREEIVSGILKNIYRVGNKIHLLTIRTQKGSRILLIEPGIRLHLTEFQRQIPEKPDNKILALRKLVRNLRIHEIKQHHSDRIAILELSGKANATIVVELFGKGNIVVLDDNQRVIYSLWYRKMRDRDLLPGKAFAFPPPLREKSIFDATLEDLLNFATEANEDVQLGKGLALKFAGGGELINEVIARSQLHPTDSAKDTPKESFELLVAKIANIKSDLAIPQPHIIEDTHGTPISFQPIHFQSLEGDLKYFSSFNKALDSFFTPMESQNIHALAEEDARFKRLKKTLEKQERRLQELQDEASRYQIIGDNIHLVAHQLDELQTTILEARRKGISWDQIQEKIELGKQKG